MTYAKGVTLALVLALGLAIAFGTLWQMSSDTVKETRTELSEVQQTLTTMSMLANLTLTFYPDGGYYNDDYQALWRAIEYQNVEFKASPDGQSRAIRVSLGGGMAYDYAEWGGFSSFSYGKANKPLEVIKPTKNGWCHPCPSD